jgi:hypothetical protein
MANRTGLHYTTIWRIQRGLFSLATHFGTVQAIGFAAGFQLVFEKSGVRMAVVD